MYCYHKNNRKYGIGKILKIEKNNNCLVDYNTHIGLVSCGNLVASHNIIDLIKAKDVLLIKDKQYDDIYKAEVVLDQDNNLSVINYDCDKLLNLQLELYKGDLIELVSVLTHEQFENYCFRIGD